MKKIFPVFLASFFIFFLFHYVSFSLSDQLDVINQQLATLQNELNQSVNATTPLVSQVNAMQNQIAAIKTQVAAIDADIVVKKQDIQTRETQLAKQVNLLNEALRDYYIKSYTSTPILLILSSSSAADITQLAAYQKAATDQDQSIITNTVITLQDLEIRKKNLESEETRLTATKQDLDAQSAKLNAVITQAKSYQSTLSGQIAALTSQQQQLIAQKLASLNIPQTAYTTQGGCSSDINVDPGFSPRFAVFTFGTPNRVGLNQYGAKGRAEAGQSYNDILNAYYANIQITNMSTSSTNITVNGTNDYGESFGNQQMSVEDYLKHIYEMPSSWPSEALKAQAIAARSYVMHAIASGQTTVPPNQSFQEVKTEENAQPWLDAVSATAGQVITSGGSPIEAWFSSTHGGYEFTSADIGWSSNSYTKEMYDGTGSVSSFSDLMNNAYDKESPWFYCDWGSRSENNNTAWLRPSELADIINVISLAKADGSTVSHLSQPDKPNPDGTDTWDANRVRQELQNRNLPAFTTISSTTINWDHGSGRVTSVSVSGDGGNVSFDGSSFKTFFNLRAPANIQIVGPLYNIEQK